MIWITGIGGGVISYQINKDYPQDAPFQYMVPATGGVVGSYTIAIADSLGNGNSCEYSYSSRLFNCSLSPFGF